MSGLEPGGASGKKEAMDSLPALRADPRVVWHDDILRFGDNDAYGHVNNAAFLVLFESGRVRFRRDHLAAVVPATILTVVARVTVEFLGELHDPDPVQSGTWIRKVGRTSFTFGQVLVSQDAIAARGEAVTVLMEPDTRRPVAIPDEARPVMERMLRSEA
jgi:acyl-CoA thioester hydrolase